MHRTRRVHVHACKKLRSTAIERQNGRCLVCGAITKLEAHHMEPWCTSPSRRFMLDNIAVLCETCHRAFHREFGRKHCTRIHLSIWHAQRRTEKETTINE